MKPPAPSGVGAGLADSQVGDIVGGKVLLVGAAAVAGLAGRDEWICRRRVVGVIGVAVVTPHLVAESSALTPCPCLHWEKESCGN